MINRKKSELSKIETNFRVGLSDKVQRQKDQPFRHLGKHNGALIV